MAALCLASAGCTGGGPPQQLSGLWSAGPAACEAGMGVRFDGDEIAVVFDRQRQALFERPRYHLEEVQGQSFRVRIEYELPVQPGGVRVAGAHGELVLIGEPGALYPASHNLVDSRTGSARMRIINDPAMRALSLKPCNHIESASAGDLRGRGAL
ncbi:MAG: hypothetical protein ABUL55_02190 [Pseudomonadota bacterium]